MSPDKPSNGEIADMLGRIAELLEAQGANVHRVRAYRTAAQHVRNADESLAKVVREEGPDPLEDIPGIGSGLASTIAEIVNTGRSSVLDRLEGEVSPEDLFAKVPGIGEELAERVAEQLDIHTLEELELAAHDGRLANVEGFGEKRVESVRVSLAGMLSRSAQRRAREAAEGKPKEMEDPPVSLLLDIDKQYRERAKSGDLRKIAPKRFNPEGEAWLPIMHEERDGWDFTALYSNTKRAHDLGKVRDWVVIYYKSEGEESQCTVVTETTGSLKGKRVIRGREGEVRDYYKEHGG